MYEHLKCFCCCESNIFYRRSRHPSGLLAGRRAGYDDRRGGLSTPGDFLHRTRTRWLQLHRLRHHISHVQVPEVLRSPTVVVNNIWVIWFAFTSTSSSSSYQIILILIRRRRCRPHTLFCLVMASSIDYRVEFGVRVIRRISIDLFFRMYLHNILTNYIYKVHN